MQSPLKALFALAVIAGLSWGTAIVSESPLAGLAAAVGLILVLHRFFFPSTHIVDAGGVHVATLLGTKTLTWNSINHVSHDTKRIYLSMRTSAVSDGGRGVLLLLNQNHDTVLAAIKARREASNNLDA